MATIVHPRGRVYELRVNVTGYLEGELADWPANIQDEIGAAILRLQARTRIREFEIQRSYCGRDVDDEPYHIIVTLVEKRKPIIIAERGEGILQ